MRIAKHSDPLEVLRFNLAWRMVAQEARTQTICRWTGLSEGRIRALYRLYAHDRGGGPLIRHRGPAPSQIGFFLKNSLLRSEAAALAMICSTLEVIPERALPNARLQLPGVQRGDALCKAYEFYRALIGKSELTLEHAVLLVTAIAQGSELSLGHCAYCGGAIVFEPSDVSRRACAACLPERQWRREPPLPREYPAAEHERPMVQQSLF